MPYQRSLFDLPEAGVQGPQTVLGQWFDDDMARQDHFAKALSAALADRRLLTPAGLPQGSPEAIAELSDPPFYTACPNPFIPQFLAKLGKPFDPEDGYEVGPHAGEFSVSKRHPIYAFHPYHTKVPPEIISTLVEHYTSVGDIVLDAFAGSGMTGVAAREAGRHAIVGDLSPVATFVAGANCITHDRSAAVDVLNAMLDESEAKWGYLYRTDQGGGEIAVNYFVWSDVFRCPQCDVQFPFFPHGVIHHETKVETRPAFPCPGCDTELNVRRVQRVIEDDRKKKQLVWVNAGTGRSRINRAPTESDVNLAERAEQTVPKAWYPTEAIDPAGYSAKLAQLGDKAISDVSRFLSRRNLIIFSDLWERAGQIQDASVRHVVRATLTSVFTVISERQGYFGGGGGMSGNLYMPIVRMEKNPFGVLRRKLRRLRLAEEAKEGCDGTVMVTTQSATELSNIPDNSIDYVYTDPPFGANIIYSEMNLAIEGWLRVRTTPDVEAVIDSSRNRSEDDYFELMKSSFCEYFRVLKPGRWMTVEFHNTAAEVWNLIQLAIREAGFTVEQVGVLDKGTTTILSDIRPGAAKHDLLISARKAEPSDQPERASAGAWLGVWQWVHQRLGEVRVPNDRKAEFLFGKMVAYHVAAGQNVPMSAAEFYRGLAERFPERHGFFFRDDQPIEQDVLQGLAHLDSQQSLITPGS